MDYEKKYNEALEDMRVIYPNLKGDAKLAVEHAFPELRESEDENIRKWIVEELEITRDAMSGKNDYSDDPDIIARLKRLDEALSWLEKQEQKPAWSEEDKEIMYSLRSFLIQAEQSGRYGSIQIAQIEQCLNWLKSLRPGWKPTEEQIYSLGTVVKGSGECSVGSVGYNLKELYEQLKKL